MQNYLNVGTVKIQSSINLLLRQILSRRAPLSLFCHNGFYIVLMTMFYAVVNVYSIVFAFFYFSFSHDALYLLYLRFLQQQKCNVQLQTAYCLRFHPVVTGFFDFLLLFFLSRLSFFMLRLLPTIASREK